MKSACTLPVIASSGAGKPEHFEEALAAGGDAALAAGIFHREEARSPWKALILDLHVQ